MKKFEEKLKEWFGSPTGFNMEFQSGYEAYSALVKRFKGYISPEDYQNTVASNEAYAKSNLVLSKENAKFVVENIELEKQIIELKSQLEKQQPEIPRFVAKFIKYTADPIHEMCAWSEHYGDNGVKCDDPELSKMLDWFGMNRNLFYEAVIKGYTVAKEKRFYLKDNRELESVGNTCIGYVTLYLKNDGYLTTDKTRAGKFTQQEVDSMAAESYEKIEVGDD